MEKNLPLKEMSINDIFNGRDSVTYEIPIYQRNYAWEKDEIAALVRDVWDACEKNKAAYFIGTLVTYDKGDSTFEVIDGQQRLTTLFLIWQFFFIWALPLTGARLCGATVLRTPSGPSHP